MSEYDKIHTNMTEGQLFETLLEFSKSCDICNLSHQACRVAPDCKECERGFWIKALRRHFGMNEAESC